MSLSKTLKKQNYDLVEGSIRNQDLLQIWDKPNLRRISLYSSSLEKAFDAPFSAIPIKNEALDINSNEKEEFDFNTGLDFVNETLQQLDIAKANIKSEIKGGKNVSVSYDNSYTSEVDKLEVEKYINAIDISKLIPSFTKELKRDNLIVITGVVMAKGLTINIDSNTNVDVGLEASLNAMTDGKAQFKKTGEKQISLIAKKDKEFPIAVKAYRIRFSGEKFKKLDLVTGNRNFFK